MHGDTQANRLAQLIQKKGNLPTYELALPLISVKKLTLKKLESNSILNLGLNDFICVLIDNNSICATAILIKDKHGFSLKITELAPVFQKENTRYEILKLSFGNIQSRCLKLGHTIDVSQVNLEKVDLIHKEKNIATASLINIDGQIAVKINKVKNDE